MEETRKVSDSRTTQTYLLMPMHLNAAGCLFGGQLLSWIDMLAGIVALRHTDSNVVTVSIDHLDFKKSAYATDVVTLDGKVTWTGNTSLEVRVDSFRENKGGTKELINTAYLVMVALTDGEDPKPKKIPRLIPETEEEKEEWAAAQKRAALRKLRRTEKF